MRTYLSIMSLLAMSLGCGNAVQVSRPEISVQGYVLARAPSANAQHFLGRRYDGGTAGDRPCETTRMTEASSSQRLSATFDQKQISKLDLGTYQVLGAAAGLEVGSLQGIRVELTTNRRAQVGVDSGCDAPVIFDAVAGNLHVEYLFDRHVDIGAKARAANIDLSVGGGYQLNESRHMLTSTLASDQYVAFQVHEASQDTLMGLLWVVGGVAAVAGGVAWDVKLAGDGFDDGVEYAPVGLYAAGTGAAIYGLLLWN